MNEAEVRTQVIMPALRKAGWADEPCQINEERYITAGPITIQSGGKPARGERRRPDYILRYRPGMPIAVVEAKSDAEDISKGLQQAKKYASILDLNFAYSANGRGIREFDRTSGKETDIEEFPTPDNLWSRIVKAQKLPATVAERLLELPESSPERELRYYQEVAVNRAMSAILSARRRVLITMATGTGKTLVAFQICWKLWNSRWNRRGDPQKPRILYLSDRNILVDDPKDKVFAPFGDARWKIRGEAIQSRQMYFALYQALVGGENQPPLYREYPRDFFDLIVVDECHRGGAKETGMWREVLEHFDAATQLGMTATPKRDDNVNTYDYFGDPIYSYSLRDGIADGFLAPYRVHRILTEWDADGWRPTDDDKERYGRDIPDKIYTPQEFERVISLLARTKAVARHLTKHLRSGNNPHEKTLVFCVDQEHADVMRRELSNLNSDIVRRFPDYVCRVTADEGSVGMGHLSDFQDVDRPSPVILTTSQLLTTGVDAPTVKNIVLFRMVNSMTEFKQIIGRGTRVREEYGKMFFNILDYAGSTTQQFADPEFDGHPLEQLEDDIGNGETIVLPEETDVEFPDEIANPPSPGIILPPAEPPAGLPRKLYFDGGYVDVVHHRVYEFSPDGKPLPVVRLTEYTAEQVRKIYTDANGLQRMWANPTHRRDVVRMLDKRGINFAHLAHVMQRPDADPIDLLCHLAFEMPLRNRKERADKLRSKKEFFEKFAPKARKILLEILSSYADFGVGQFDELPEALKVSPLSEHGNIVEIAHKFGGMENFRTAVKEMQELLYAA